MEVEKKDNKILTWEDVNDGKLKCFVCKKNFARDEVDHHSIACSASTVNQKQWPKGAIPTIREIITTVLDPMQLEKEIKILKEQVRVSESEKSILRGSIDQLEHSKRTMRKEKSQLEEQVDHLQDENSSLKSKYAELEERCKALEFKLKDITGNFVGIEDGINLNGKIHTPPIFDNEEKIPTPPVLDNEEESLL